MRAMEQYRTRPLTFSELLNWTPCALSEASRASVPYRARGGPPPKQRVLHCHDMAGMCGWESKSRCRACAIQLRWSIALTSAVGIVGGYQEDDIPTGKQLQTMYNFRHWNCVDIFVYFSHANVAPPPPGWINAAHRHGVQVLGTIMTEWDQGVLDNELLLKYDTEQHE